jgi:predicted amidohydrolase YtcJ
MNVPIQSILGAGGKVVMEMDDRRVHRKEGGAFAHIKYAVTRRDSEGRTWGAKQAVDKTTALKMFTRWAAEYVLRENVLGSLEPASGRTSSSSTVTTSIHRMKNSPRSMS